MTVAVAYQVNAAGRQALQVAVDEACHRQTHLAVIHVVESLDSKIIEQHRTGIGAEVENALSELGRSELDWDLYLQTRDEALTRAVLDAVTEVDADILVVGARHRSATGKFLLGSITETLLMQAEIPVLVVKSETRD